MNLSSPLISGIFIMLLLVSCQDKELTNNPKTKPISPTGSYHQCNDPRPEICTKEFRPVCAKVDTGVRCITTPCPSSENKTYSNACSACSDSKVHGYWKNACPQS